MKTLAQALVALVLVGLLAACGPSQDDAKAVKFPDPKLATGPYTLVHFTADW